LEGIVISRYSSFYYVNLNNKIWECRLRGKHRIKGQDVIAGDKVVFTAVNEKQGIIEKILPRDTELYRPAIANVSQLLIVMSLKSPEPNYTLLDRLLILGAMINLKILIVFNKLDLVDKNNLEKPLYYKKVGYNVFFTSVKKRLGIDDIKVFLKDEITVLAGLSGVGKSSILNALEPDLSLKIGSLSKKIEMGRHTTRYVQLLPIKEGGLIADTPGFSCLRLPKNLTRKKLGLLYPEIETIQDKCKFSDCLHWQEPECKVVEAVKAGEISKWRYDNYLKFLEEIIANERSF
jgi:ribosome biogenesis GTPase